MPTELRHRTLDVNGLAMHLVGAGPRDGPPLLLLHGFPEAWFGWQRQIAPLAAAGFHVLVPDQRGYNLTARPQSVSAYGLDALTGDVSGLLDALGVERVLLAAHDWGAAVAWWAAVRFPERIERMAILNVPHPTVMRRHLLRDGRQRRRSWYVFFFQLPWLPEFLLRRRDYAFLVKGLVAIARKGTFSPADLQRYREAWSRPGTLTAMLNWYRAALRHPPRRPASVRVSVPTRILWGLRDPALGADMVDPSLALCDHGSAERFPELSHWLQHEEPELVAERLIAFFGPAGSGDVT